MAVEVTGSKFARNNKLYVVVICLAFAIWFGYDGWLGAYRQKELDKNDGQPTANLRFNQLAPIPLLAIAIFSLVTSLGITKKKIVADDNGLVLSDGNSIPYQSIKKIDKRQLEKEGHFTIEYEQDSAIKNLKLSDRKYDNLGLLLDEIVRQTGAAPADTTPKENS